jgi:hypothetical protein
MTFAEYAALPDDERHALGAVRIVDADDISRDKLARVSLGVPFVVAFALAERATLDYVANIQRYGITSAFGASQLRTLLATTQAEIDAYVASPCGALTLAHLQMRAAQDVAATRANASDDALRLLARQDEETPHLAYLRELGGLAREHNASRETCECYGCIVTVRIVTVEKQGRATARIEALKKTSAKDYGTLLPQALIFERGSFARNAANETERGNVRLYPPRENILTLLGYTAPNDGVARFGVELETFVDSWRTMGENMTRAFAALRSFLAKNDGSVSGGLELNTLPMTVAQHVDFVQTLFAAREGAIGRVLPGARNGNACGIHIHTGRAHLTERQQHSIVNFCMAGNAELHTFLNRIARRAPNSYCVRGTAYRHSSDAMHRNPTDATVRAESGDSLLSRTRYDALNVTPTTLEFRLFASTTDSVIYLANVEFVAALCAYAKTVDLIGQGEGPEAFVEWLQANAADYPHLMLRFSRNSQLATYVTQPAVVRAARARRATIATRTAPIATLTPIPSDEWVRGCATRAFGEQWEHHLSDASVSCSRRALSRLWYSGARQFSREYAAEVGRMNREHNAALLVHNNGYGAAPVAIGDSYWNAQVITARGARIMADAFASRHLSRVARQLRPELAGMSRSNGVSTNARIVRESFI